LGEAIVGARFNELAEFLFLIHLFLSFFFFFFFFFF
jgi:hypothetical protein